MWFALQRKGGQKWKEKPNTDSSGNNRLGEWSASGSSGQTQALVQPIQFGRVQVNPVPVQGQKGIWKPKSYGTVGRATTVEAEAPADKSTAGLQRNGVGLAAPQKSSSGASKVFKGNLLENFTVDNSTYAQVQIRATFYPKFENEKSDQEVQLFFLCSLFPLHSFHLSNSLVSFAFLKWEYPYLVLCLHFESSSS